MIKIILFLFTASSLLANPILWDFQDQEKVMGVSFEDHVMVTYEVIEHINAERTRRGLKPFKEDRYVRAILTMLSMEYAVTMMRLNTFGHNLPSRGLSFYAQGDYYALDGVPLWEYRAVQNLALRAPHISPSQQAKVFDNSPSHAEVLYHERAEHIGWAYVITEDTMWIAVHILIRNR